MHDLSPNNLFRIALASALLFALSACGGHSRGDGSLASSSSEAPPAFDVSGNWTTTMDNHHLGLTTFSMAPSGALSGTLQIDSGDKGSVSGHLADHDADYTVTFGSRSFLASVVFSSAESSAAGTIVDADGHVHSLKLNR